MHRVAIRLTSFAVAVTLAFGGAYAFGQWLPGDHTDDDHTDMQMQPGETMP